MRLRGRGALCSRGAPWRWPSSSAFLELNGSGDVAAAHGLLVGALEAHQGSAGDPGFVEALHNLLEVCLSSTGIDRFAAFRNQVSQGPCARGA